ncbi:hypothetical protein [Vagococcus penaei]|nr:hypothetical protein [Vagococcus penaei]
MKRKMIHVSFIIVALLLFFFIKPNPLVNLCLIALFAWWIWLSPFNK